MKITKYIGKQFGNPTGIGGKASTYMMNKMNQKQYHATVAALKLSGQEKVLDIGFGNGYLLKQLAENNNCQFYGVELSKDMVQAASQKNKLWINSGKVQLFQGSVSKLDFENGFFDKIYSVNTVYFWAELNQGYAEIWRVLKTGGVFVNTIYTKKFLESWPYTKYNFALYSLEELMEAGKNAGFQVELIPIQKGVSYCLLLTK